MDFMRWGVEAHEGHLAEEHISADKVPHLSPLYVSNYCSHLSTRQSYLCTRYSSVLSLAQALMLIKLKEGKYVFVRISLQSVGAV